MFRWLFSKEPELHELPTWLQAYKQGKTHPAEVRKQPLNAVRFVVFDTETTGFHLKKDYLLSIGATTVQQNSIWLHDSFEVLVEAPATKGKEHIEIHQILPTHSLTATPLPVALEQFVRFAGNAVLVGHHVQYDLSMVSEKLRATFGVKLHNAHLDTGQLAIRLEHPPGVAPNIVGKRYTLDALCERYRIEPHDRHTAAGDAYITAQLLLKLLQKAQQRGLHTVDELLG